MVNFESLLSEYGKETGMMGDYAFGAHFLLENVTFVLSQGWGFALTLLRFLKYIQMGLK